MLDTSFNNSQEFVFNSVAGTIVKSTPDSVITRCHMNSKLAKRLLNHEGPFVELSGVRRKVEVLQVMLCGDSQFLIEYTLQTG